MHKIEVYSISTCSHCSHLKKTFAEKGIEYTNYDVIEDKKAADRMIEISGQMGVPVTVIDGVNIVVGDDFKEIQKYLDLPADESSDGTSSSGKVYDLIIIGAGVSGLAAAMYAARKNMNFIVIGGAVGGMVRQTTFVENYPGLPNVSGDDLMTKFVSHAEMFGAKIVEDVASGISNSSGIFTIETLNGKYLAKSVIAATGRSPRLSGAKGESDYFGKGIAVCATCDAPLYKDKIAGVLGGGNSAFDTALDLAEIAKEVHIISRSAPKADEILVKRLEKYDNVFYHIGRTIKEYAGDEFLKYVVLEKAGSSETEMLVLDGLFIGIGLDCNTYMFEGFVNMNEKKEIIVDENCRTNVDGFFAAGDSTSISAKQIASSAGEGVKALLSAYDYLKYL